MKQAIDRSFPSAAPTLPIFPVKNEPYARAAEWGTLFKMYEYAIRASTNMMLEGGLMGRVRDPAARAGAANPLPRMSGLCRALGLL